MTPKSTLNLRGKVRAQRPYEYRLKIMSHNGYYVKLGVQVLIARGKGSTGHPGDAEGRSTVLNVH